MHGPWGKSTEDWGISTSFPLSWPWLGSLQGVQPLAGWGLPAASFTQKRRGGQRTLLKHGELQELWEFWAEQTDQNRSLLVRAKSWRPEA